MRASNLPVSSNLLKEKALEIVQHLGTENISASNGWIDQFCQKFNIVYKTVSGESKSADPETTKHWKESILSSLSNNYAPKDIFNLDETALFYNLHSKKALCYKNASHHGE